MEDNTDPDKLMVYAFVCLDPVMFFSFSSSLLTNSSPSG